MMQFYVPEVVAVEQVTKITFWLILRLVNGLENHCEAREHFALSLRETPEFQVTPAQPALSDQTAPAGTNCYTKFFSFFGA